jgi:hypothetical protein
MHVLLLPGPDGAALRLVLLAELVSAAGFQRDRLYVEWQLHFDPELWVLQHSEQEVVQPGLIQVRAGGPKGLYCVPARQSRGAAMTAVWQIGNAASCRKLVLQLSGNGVWLICCRFYIQTLCCAGRDACLADDAVPC